MPDRGYFLIEARWEHTRNAPGEDAFFKVDEIGGSLDDAKRTAQTYLDRHVVQAHLRLEWVVGVTRKSRCYYAHAANILTFRITS